MTDVQPQEQSLSSLSSSLTPILEVLDSFNHRNKNQHRVAHWWARFDLLRRSLRRLVLAVRGELRRCELRSLNPKARRRRGAETGKGTGVKDGKVTAGDEVRVRAEWLCYNVIPGSYLAFTQLSADQQHAPLGLLLLGLTAKLRTLLSEFLEASYPQPAESSARLLLQAEDDGTKNPSPGMEGGKPEASSVDLGVAIPRPQVHVPSSGPTGGDIFPVTAKKDSGSGSGSGSRSKTPHLISSLAGNANVVKPPLVEEPISNPTNLAGESSKATDKDLKAKKKKRKKTKGKGDEFSQLFDSLL